MNKRRYEEMRANLESFGFGVNHYNVENFEIGKVWIHETAVEFEAFHNGFMAYSDLVDDFLDG